MPEVAESRPGTRGAHEAQTQGHPAQVRLLRPRPVSRPARPPKTAPEAGFTIRNPANRAVNQGAVGLRSLNCQISSPRSALGSRSGDGRIRAAGWPRRRINKPDPRYVERTNT